MIIAGIDEAGYGPLLGPLVVSATAFEVPGELAADEAPPCIWRALKEAVIKKPLKARGRIWIADSKAIHARPDGDKLLERAVLAVLRNMRTDIDHAHLRAGELLKILGCVKHDLPAHPWYATYDPLLPAKCESGDLQIATNMLAGAMQSAKVRPVMMRSALISERAFNTLVGGTNNKASALVSVTLEHLYHLHTNFGNRGLVVAIDKQGGRDHYTNLLLTAFPDASLKVIEEGEAGSVYMMTEGDRRTLLSFRAKGETHALPTALASMICKYLRELFMSGFNAWWCDRIPTLRPTAGYYSDGTRWLSEVEPHLQRLGVRREELVRSR